MRSNLGSFFSYQVFQKNTPEGFSAVFPIRKTHQSFHPGKDDDIRQFGREYNEYEVKDSAVTPDGKYWVIPGTKPGTTERRPHENYVLIGDSATLKPVKCLEVPDGEFSKELFATGSKRNSGSPDTDPGSCAMFSPNGELLAVGLTTGEPEKQTSIVKLWKTESWQEVATLSSDALQGSVGKVADLKLLSFSPDSKLMAGIVVHDSQTGRGKRQDENVIIWDVVNAKILRQYPLASLSGDRRVRRPRAEPRQQVAFLNNTNVVVSESKEDWSDEANRSLTTLSVKGWNVVDGHERVALHICVGTNLFGSCDAISPDYRILIARIDKHLRVWDLDQLSKLQNDVIEGDKLWDSGRHSEAFKHYCALVGDEMAWFVEGNLPRAWSRCVDAYAEAGDAANGRKLVSFMQTRTITVSAETTQGQKLVQDFLDEQIKAKQQETQERRESEAKRLAEARATNRANNVVARHLTKKQFIEKMKQTLARGQIDDHFTYCIFEDYSFQDTFGDPDSNLEWVNSKRLFLYHCLDGAIQLTVTCLGPQTFVEGVNQY